MQHRDRQLRLPLRQTAAERLHLSLRDGAQPGVTDMRDFVAQGWQAQQIPVVLTIGSRMTKVLQPTRQLADRTTETLVQRRALGQRHCPDGIRIRRAGHEAQHAHLARLSRHRQGQQMFAVHGELHLRPLQRRLALGQRHHGLVLEIQIQPRP